MPKGYFEDCIVGDRFATPGRTITETDVVMFAAFSGDWNLLHTDAEYAASADFGERIAHGMLTLVVGTPLIFRPDWYGVLPKSLIAIVGLDKVRFIAPVKIGDTIHLEGKVAEMTKMPEQRGIITLKYRIKNQRNKTVISGRLKALAGCRPLGDPDASEI